MMRRHMAPWPVTVQPPASTPAPPRPSSASADLVAALTRADELAEELAAVRQTTAELARLVADLVATPRLAYRPRELAAALGVSERVAWGLMTTTGADGVRSITVSDKAGSARLAPASEVLDWIARRLEATS